MRLQPSAEEDRPVIEVSELEFAYAGSDFEILIPDFRVATGSRTALIGPSGSGKSTLLHLLAGVLVPRQGRIVVDGQNLPQLSSSARSHFRITKLGLVFQSFELLEYLSVLDNLLLPFRLDRHLRLTFGVRQRAMQLAEDLEISKKLNRFPAQISQGERQRVAIGRALITEPSLLLADEPTGNLDPGNKQRVLDLMLEVALRRNVTVLMVTHDHGLLDQFEQVYEVRMQGGGQACAGITPMKGCGDYV